MTAPIWDSFALVRVPGVAGAPVYVDQQLAGHTDAHGNLFVNNLRHYATSNISIGYDTLPIDVALDRANVLVTPASRGGATVAFGVHRMRTIGGTIEDESGNPPPAYARMIVEGATQHAETRLDEIGGFVLDDLAPALYHFTVTLDAKHQCFGTLRVPSAAAFASISAGFPAATRWLNDETSRSRLRTRARAGRANASVRRARCASAVRAPCSRRRWSFRRTRF